MIEEHDHRSRRCPMLGHDIAFSYCRRPGREIPCARVYDCWWEKFDINAFIDTYYSPESIAEVLKPKAPKIVSLVEIIQRAQRKAQQEDKT